jgi:hypothetical protein
MYIFFKNRAILGAPASRRLAFSIDLEISDICTYEPARRRRSQDSSALDTKHKLSKKITNGTLVITDYIDFITYKYL